MQSILVVDDDFAMRRGMVLTLRGGGYDVFEAADGATAKEIISAHPIDLAVVDLFLGRDDGVRIAHMLQCSRPDMHILIVSAHEYHAQAQSAQKIFKDHYLDKASLDKELLKKVEEVLRAGNKSIITKGVQQ